MKYGKCEHDPPPPIINVFIAIFDQFNVFLLKNKTKQCQKKVLLTPNIWTVV